MSATATKKKAKAKVGKALPSVLELDLPEWTEAALDVIDGLSKQGDTVAPEQLLDSPLNPRRKIDPVDVAKIAASIRIVGWFGQVLARRTGERLELVFGHCRKAAALSAGLALVRVEVRELSDLQVIALQLVENMARNALHPLEEAAGLAAMIDAALKAGEALDAEGVGDRVGRSASFVRKRLQLLHLSTLAREAFDAGHMLLGHAELLSHLRHDEQDRLVTEQNLDGKGSEWESVPSVRDLGLTIRDEVLLDLKNAPWELHDAGLVPAAGACEACPKRTGAGSGLFAEVVQDARCADAACWETKKQALVELARKRAAARAPEGRGLVEISTDLAGYSTKAEEGAPLPRDLWRPAGGKLCDATRPGVVVRGTPKEVGKDLDVCTDTKCKAHWSKASAGTSGLAGGGREPDTRTPEEKEARKKELAEAKVRKAAEAITVHAIVEHVRDKCLDNDDRRMIARALWRALWRDVKVAWARTREVDDADRADEAFDDAIGKSVGEDGLEAVLVELALAQEIEHGPDHRTQIEELKLAAKRHGVDAKQVMRDAKDAVAPAKKPESKPAKAAAAGKKAKAGKAKKGGAK